MHMHLPRLQRSNLVKNTSHILGHALGFCAAAALVAGCSGASQSPFVPSSSASEPAQRTRERAASTSSGGYVYVSNLTNSGASQLLVYPAGTANATPLKTITQGLVDASGVTVDSSGNVYVANGSGGNVLEFSPGGAALVQTYSQGLVDPVAVTVANGTLYVSDQGNAGNGYSQQVVEYTVGNGAATMAIGGVGNQEQRNAGIAVDPLATKNTFFLAASSMTAIPEPPACQVNNAYMFAENLQPTLWMLITLSNNHQASGVAFDAGGHLYVADICADDVAVYTNVANVWTYAGTVAGTFNAPMYLTVENGFLAVPSSGAGSSTGYVTVIDLTGRSPTTTVDKGLTHPIGAAVASSS
jgi:hypothetical protein